VSKSDHQLNLGNYYHTVLLFDIKVRMYYFDTVVFSITHSATIMSTYLTILCSALCYRSNAIDYLGKHVSLFLFQLFDLLIFNKP